MKSQLKIAIIIVIALANTACSSMGVLKAGPAPDSGFLGESAAFTSQDENFPFHRTYFPEETKESLSKIQKIYVAKVDVSHVKNHSLYFSTEEAAQTAIEEDTKEIGKYTQETFSNELRKNVSDRFIITDEAVNDGYVLELALVEITPTDVTRNVMGTALGTFVPGGGIIAYDSTGTVAIEGRLREVKSGKTVFAFADREAGKLAVFSLKDFSLYSHAREAIQDWAEQITQAFGSSGRTLVADSSPITLSPI